MKKSEQNTHSAPLTDGVDDRVAASEKDAADKHINADLAGQDNRQNATHNAGHSFLSLLVWAFVTFMLISIVSILLIFAVTTWAANKDVIRLGSITVSPYLIAVFSVFAIILLLVAVLILYIRYIHRRVERPLKALDKALSEFATNGYRNKIDYSGTKEFEQLVQSYNEMVTLLSTSEAQRSALEADRQRMLAGLSHDLKTPITIIQGFSKAIRDGLVGEEDKQKYLNLISSKSESMGELINEFYEFSKLDHPDFKLNVESIDVAELARTYLAGRYDEFEIMGYSLEADITEERLLCEADKVQLTRVFENLTNNFFKYTPEGSTLYLHVDTDGENALITFADNGGGISEDIGDDIFAPFVVGEKSRNKQGSGLGLAICKKIITAHGGTITMNPTPKEGYNTEFDIVLKLL